MIEYASNTDKVIEFDTGNGWVRVIVSGIAKGYAYRHENNLSDGKKIEVPFDSLPEEIKEIYKKYH